MYQEALRQLRTEPEVGTPQGFADRGVVADALFAESTGGINEFMCKDIGVFKALERFAVPRVPVARNVSLVNTLFPPGGSNLTAEFTIVVTVAPGEVRSLKVIAIRNTAVP
jgi:hypothetical protein